MIDWKKFWSEYPASVHQCEFLRQVGHTIGGQPYSKSQFDAMVASIRDALELGHSHRLLDVCCGNGVLTTELAQHCDSVYGIDFSAPLIDVARKYHGGGNINYHLMDALDLDIVAIEGAFDRVLMYAALQHFKPSQLALLLRGILKHTTAGSVIVLGGVLDVRRKHQFLDTPEKRAMYRTYKAEGRDRLGTWWDENFIQEVAKSIGLRCEIDDYSARRPGGYYRFDVKLC